MLTSLVPYMANAAESAGDSNGCEGGAAATVEGAASGGRPPRLPRWTRQEILVLIRGKRVVESRGSRRRTASPAAAVTGSPTEPKWASVSTYCRRHGVHRGPLQCRKRWSNLASDYKKIKEWEAKGKDSFWAMRNDLRRERRLPGFFDREVYDILGGATDVAAEEEDNDDEETKDGNIKAAAVVFDSGRTAAEDGLFSDFEEEKEADEDDEERTPTATPPAALPPPLVAVPISEKYEPPTHQETSTDQAAAKHTNPEKETPSHAGQKRRRTSEEGGGDTNMQNQLIEVLDRNSRLLSAQLEAQNVNSRLDRDQRKEQATSMLNILGKLADALGKIADKL